MKKSIREENWDEAYSLVIANNRHEMLLKILESPSSQIPKDKIVEECLLMELRKILMYYPALNWFKNYICEKEKVVSKKTLKKFKNDIERVDLKEV